MTMHLAMVDCGGDVDVERGQRQRHEQAMLRRMLGSHESIHREMSYIDGGIRTVTTSEDPEITALLRVHVPETHRRLRESARLRGWDPLYRALYDNRERIEVRVVERPDGVELEEVSEDPHVAQLIRAHGDVVNTFVAAARLAARSHPFLGAVSEQVA